MSLFCKNAGCVAQSGMCKHEKTGAVVLVLGGLLAIAHWGMNLF